ncbi:hypothetical protein GCM10022245_34620 [Streptomyces mayteni]
MRGQGPQQPLAPTAPEVEHAAVAARDGVAEEIPHRVVVERSRDGMVRVGETGQLFTIHRRSVTRRAAVRTPISGAAAPLTRRRSAPTVNEVSPVCKRLLRPSLPREIP